MAESIHSPKPVKINIKEVTVSKNLINTKKFNLTLFRSNYIYNILKFFPMITFLIVKY